MRIISVEVENFASYRHLKFDYSGQGLTLLRGLTGSGKSTLCDSVPWILFGKTAKGGAVDEVLSWPGDQVSYGASTLTVDSGLIHIHRIRGKAKDNDLWYTLDIDLKAYRGKDLPDTQRLLNDLLGFDYDLYLAGAYYHEFSQTAQFFTTTAKNRRAISEQLVDLSLATKLQPKLVEDKKVLSKQLDETEKRIYTLGTNIELLKRMYMAELVKFNEWDAKKQQRISLLQNKIVNFEDDKNRTLEELVAKDDAFEEDEHKKQHKQNVKRQCPECGNWTGETSEGPAKRYIVRANPYTEQIERELARTNNYVNQMIELEAEINPHKEAAEKMALEKFDSEHVLEDYKVTQALKTADLDELEVLQQVVADYRSVAITNTIQDLETKTNKLLTDHFDAEIRVSFAVEDADKLEVTIHKDGNECVFTQLSKGQRCLLKLCFGLSVMEAVQNHHGIKFEQVFLDEALDGLDDTLKTKALGLLQTLGQQYDSIFLVEHSSELKAAIDNQFEVTLINGESHIEKA